VVSINAPPVRVYVFRNEVRSSYSQQNPDSHDSEPSAIPLNYPAIILNIIMLLNYVFFKCNSVNIICSIKITEAVFSPKYCRLYCLI